VRGGLLSLPVFVSTFNIACLGERIYIYIYTHPSRTLLVSGGLLSLPVFVSLFNIACLQVRNTRVNIHTSIQDSPCERLLDFFACVRVIIQYCVFRCESIHVYI